MFSGVALSYKGTLTCPGALRRYQLPPSAMCVVCSTSKSTQFCFLRIGVYYAFDILPGLKAGDSYCAQGRRNAARESLRWVPAAGGMTAPLTSQANRACPALSILIAPSALSFPGLKAEACRAPGEG
jgi:hypothetical protein